MNPDIYKKVKLIPNHVLISLKKNKEYYKTYLDFMEFKEAKITKTKALIYISPDKKSGMYLLEGDSIEITQSNNHWLKINYYPIKRKLKDKIIVGWIRRADIQ